jgi:hypothetical protein
VTPASIPGIGWLLLALGPLLLSQRALHIEIQYLFIGLTRKPKLSLALFSLLFLPGVCLHEISHFVMARLLGVRTGRISLIPQAMSDGKLRLGYVETAQAGWLRDALIGAAPLITAGLFIGTLGAAHLGLAPLAALVEQGDLSGAVRGLTGLPALPDFWIWFYLVFVISSTMFPSASDRQAWLPVLLVCGLLLGISLLVGAGPWLAANLKTPLDRVLRATAGVYWISLAVHLALLGPVWLIRVGLFRLMGLRPG